MAGFTINVFNEIELRAFCFHPVTSQVGINVFHMQLRASVGSVPITSLSAANSLSLFLSSYYADLLDSSARFAGVSVQDFPARHYMPSWSTSGNSFGTVVGNDVPTQLSGLIGWRTNRAGPKGRGRSYIPFVSATSVTASGGVAAGYKAALDAMGTALSGEFTVASGGTNYLWSLEIVDNKGLGDRYLVESGVGRDSFATQRRRGDFGRMNSLPPELT